MQITKQQQRALHRARALRGKPFPVIGSMLRSWKLYLGLSAVLGGYAGWAWSLGAVEASVASLGFLAGLIARDVTWFRLHARMWPVNVEITDWAKVDALLDGKNDA